MKSPVRVPGHALSDVFHTESGWTFRCECGRTEQRAATKRDALLFHRDHRIEVKFADIWGPES